MRNKIKSLVQNTVVIGVSLVVLAALTYENFLKQRNDSPHRRPIDF